MKTATKIKILNWVCTSLLGLPAQILPGEYRPDPFDKYEKIKLRYTGLFEVGESEQYIYKMISLELSKKMITDGLLTINKAPYAANDYIQTFIEASVLILKKK